jgi:NADH dehydrogenase I D subunit
MLNVAPVYRPYETLPNLNDIRIPAVAPLPSGETEDTARIVERFGADILAAGLQNGQAWIWVKPAKLIEVVSFLKNEMGYNALTDVTAVDRSKLPIAREESRFHTVYQLRSYGRRKHLGVVCPLENRDQPVAPSLSGLYQSAIFSERETWDLMGVRFQGLTDHRRILMPENWPYHPLQKQVPVGGEPVPFSLTYDDPEFATLGTQILAADSVAPALPPGMNRQHMIINMGPHHPSTHGVLRLVVELDGETVVKVDPDLGYLHSGFEKTGESKRYKDFVYYTDRMDYLSAMGSNLGYCLAVERLLGIDVPERAKVIRVMMAELQRIASHLFWLSTHTLDVSGVGMSVLFYATRERERILDLFEMVCGARLTLSYIRVGGVWKDLPPMFLPALQELVTALPGFFDEYERMLTDAPVWRSRLIGIGKLSAEEAINMGLTGPLLRGSGVDWDLRRDMPYSGYESYDFKVITGTDGDCFSRYLVRMAEMRESVRIVQQAIKRMPEGLYKTEDRKVSTPPRAELDVSMEALIHHFKLMTEGFRVPPGMGYHAVENSKGEIGFYLYSDGSAVPYRLHVRGPSYNNMYAISKMSEGLMLSDVVANIASIDPVLGEVDR